MAAFTKNLLVATGLSAVLATVSGAQGAQPAAQRACQIDENSGQLGRVLLSISLAQSNQNAQKWPEAANHLRSAIKALEKPDRKNELGQRLVMGKALSLWLNQPEVGPTPTRGTLGFTQSPDAPIDVMGAVDSIFSQIEASNPACEGETAAWRAQKPWLNLVQQAIEAVNAGSIDSAEALASRSLRLYRRAPYAYMVLASVAQNRGQVAKALQYHQQTIDAAADTTHAEARRQALLSIGNLAADVADTASGAVKAQFARDARTAYERVIAEAPNSQQASQARAGLVRSLQLAGDTAAVRAAYRDQIANPTKYDVRDIMASGIEAARSNQWQDAAALFENASKLNPHSRDALYNLSISYYELGQFAKMLPVLNRLVAIDPSNADNWLLFMRAYNGLAKQAQQAKNSVLNRALTDSTMKYFERSEALPLHVTFSEFITLDSTARIRGTAEDRRGRPSALTQSATGQRYKTERTREGRTVCRDTQTGSVAAAANCAGRAAVPPDTGKRASDTEPKTYVIRVQFLDKDGQVAASRDVTVGPLKPGERASFSATADARGVVGYRYTVAP